MKIAALAGAALVASVVALPAAAQTWDPIFGTNQPSVFGIVGGAVDAGVGIATAPFAPFTGSTYDQPAYSGRSVSNYPASLDDPRMTPRSANNAYRVYRQSPYQPYN